jgi:hypothetical protein
MAHGDSKKLKALKALVTLIQGVTPGNGHDFDLTSKVFRGRGLFGAEQEVPFVSIVEPDGSEPALATGGKDKIVRLELWRLLVQGWATGDAQNPTDILYNLMAAVESRISLAMTPGSFFRLGGLVANVRIGPGYIPAENPQLAAAMCFYLPVELQIAMNVSDPWNATSKL